MAETNHVLNDRIAALIGWQPKTIEHEREWNCSWKEEQPDFSGDIAAAWRVVDWMNRQGWWVHLTILPNRKARVVVDDGLNQIGEAMAATALEAICLAAVEVMKERNQ